MHLQKIVLLLFLFILGCSQQETKTIRPVRAEQVVFSNVSLSFSYSGSVRSRYESQLAFQVGGKIIHRYVDVGDKVVPKQLLATIDTRDLKLALDSKLSQLEAIQTERDFSKSELDRYTPLAKKGQISASLYQQKLAEYKKDNERFEQATTDKELAEQQLEYANLYSDYSGVITKTLASPGQVVSAGQPVIELARSDEKEIEIAIPEQRINELKKANRIQVQLWADPKKIYTAKLQEIASDADPVTRTYLVKLAVLDADSKMQLGMTAKVFFDEVSQKQRIILPLSAIFFENQKAYVWIVNLKNMTVTPRAVTIGESTENRLEILSGLKSGEWVVTAGTHNLYPGQEIKLITNTRK